MSPDRRSSEEALRRKTERELRPDGPREADRDHGLESAWSRRLAGAALRRGEDLIRLGADGRYTARFADGTESGTWRITSCVGRASLMLNPGDGRDYGYLLRRSAAGVELNGRRYEG